MSSSHAEALSLEETLRFEKAVPGLLAELAGKWVVFKDGKVEVVCESEREAYAAGLERFGVSGAHIVACVAEPKPRMISAAARFNIG